MPLTLGVAEGYKRIRNEPVAVLYEEVGSYFGSMLGFPRLRKLSRADPYGDTTFDTEDCSKLHDEVIELQSRLQNRMLPEPPSAVDLEGSDDENWGEPFGWSGLESFAADLATVLITCLSESRPLLALGD